MNACGDKKERAGESKMLPSPLFSAKVQLDELQLNRPPHGRPAVVNVEFAVDTLGMSTNRA
jgi:hypothetical protein